MNVYVYLNNMYGDKWQSRNFNLVNIPEESLLLGTIELVLSGRSIVGSATMAKDFSQDITKRLKIACIEDALNSIPQPVKQYTDSQITMLEEFKLKHKIDTIEKLDSYINTWKPGSTSNDLTPDNIDEFINYITSLERKQV